MPRVNLLVLVGLLAVGPFLSASGVTAQVDSASVAVDSARVAVRRPPDTLLAQFRADPAFNYDHPQGWTWWRDLRRWVWDRLTHLFGRDVPGGQILPFVFYAGLALLVGYAAYMLVQLRSDARAPGRAAPETVAHPQTAEEMRAIDYEARLKAAVAEGHYRRAVRLLYQQTLQRLDRAGAIAWRPSKTNRAYVNELGAEGRPAFKTLTRLFERVWYGGAAVDEEHFAQIQMRFESFWARDPVPEPDEASDSEEPPTPANRGTHRDTPNADRPSA